MNNSPEPIICAYCGKPATELHMDHVVPRSRGGPDSPINLIGACADCNREKHDKLPSEWLEVVPEAVAEIERRVCKIVGDRITARREWSRNHPPKHATCDARTRVVISCEDCGDELQDHPDKGWLWWSRNWRDSPDSKDYPVDRVGVRCVKCHSVLHRSERGYLSDWYLTGFTGDRAMTRMWCLLRDHRWTQEASEKLHDILSNLQHLPTHPKPMPWEV